MKTEIFKTLAEKLIKCTENNSEKNGEKDCTDRIVDILKDIIDSELKDFEEVTKLIKIRNHLLKT